MPVICPRCRSFPARFKVANLSSVPIQNVTYARTEYSVLYTPFWPENIGHFLYDDLYASFYAINQFYGHSDDLDISTYTWLRCEQIHTVRSEIQKCKFNYEVNFPTLMAAPSPTYTRQMTLDGTALFFKNVVIGLHYFSFFQARPRPQRLIWESFVHKLRGNLGTVQQYDKYLQPYAGKQILMLNKTEGRGRFVVNFNELYNRCVYRLHGVSSIFHV